MKFLDIKMEQVGDIDSRRAAIAVSCSDTKVAYAHSLRSQDIKAAQKWVLL